MNNKASYISVRNIRLNNYKFKYDGVCVCAHAFTCEKFRTEDGLTASRFRPSQKKTQVLQGIQCENNK